VWDGQRRKNCPLLKKYQYLWNNLAREWFLAKFVELRKEKKMKKMKNEKKKRKKMKKN